MEDQKKEEEQEIIPVEDSVPEDYLIKHPLQNTWTLWYYENDRSKTWEENQREVFSFDTIEDFWSLYNHIKTASELRQGCDYSLFKKGVRPMWEDSANKQGGRWLINLEKKQRNSDLDKYWLEIILCMIGEAFDSHSDEVCGAVINIRGKGDKIGLWTADAHRTQSVMEIGRKLKERLKIPKNVILGYQVHKDTAAKSGSVTKNSFQV
uniref:eIF-4F 25 kDa subunit n=1 Tax=Liposcelis bostrychophila TaxID=185214 RepID=A0A481SXA6_LIPBO|nr:eukaryotic translation initiation factor 4e [Liposcelis bostrychophila]